MKWLNAIRRWFGLPEHPPAVTGDTSVLFVLQSVSPRYMSFDEIQTATHIEVEDLRKELERLAWFGKVHVEAEPEGTGFGFRRYRIVPKPERLKEQGL